MNGGEASKRHVAPLLWLRHALKRCHRCRQRVNLNPYIFAHIAQDPTNGHLKTLNTEGKPSNKLTGKVSRRDVFGKGAPCFKASIASSEVGPMTSKGC